MSCKLFTNYESEILEQTCTKGFHFDMSCSGSSVRSLKRFGMVHDACSSFSFFYCLKL